jgi:hypothetical protein
MKVRRQLDAIEPMVFGPLHGIKPEDWHRAPKGKWSIAQIVAHLAVGVDRSSVVLEQRKDNAGMVRRTNPGQAVLRHFLLLLGQFPIKLKSPESTTPPDKPDADLVAAQYRMALERFATLDSSWSDKQKREIFVQHPRMGDLTLPEWIRFHYLHARHHAKQIHDRLKWMKKTGKK